MENFCKMCFQHLRQFFSHTGNILSWEVNYWAFLEKNHGLEVEWFAADHNDSMVNVPGSATEKVEIKNTCS